MSSQKAGHPNPMNQPHLVAFHVCCFILMNIPKPTRTACQPCHISAWRWNWKMLGKDSPLNPGHSWEFALWEWPFLWLMLMWPAGMFGDLHRKWGLGDERLGAIGWSWMDGYYIWAVSLMIPVFAHDFCCFYILHIMHLKKTTQTTKGFFSHWGQNHRRPTGSFFPCWSWGSCGNLWMRDHHTAHAKQGAGCPGIAKVSHD